MPACASPAIETTASALTPYAEPFPPAPANDDAAILARAAAGPEGQAFLERLLVDECAAAHVLMMRLAASTTRLFDQLDPSVVVRGRSKAVTARVETRVRRLGGAAGEMFNRYRLAMLSLHRLRRTARAAEARAPRDVRIASAPPASSAATSAPVLANRGRLRNGNPSGDYLAAPRCGAKTRGGCACRQPAMPNGRCRFHGGKSTGPRTAEGRAIGRTARLTHGRYSAAAVAERALAEAARQLTKLRAAGTAGGRYQEVTGEVSSSAESTPYPATSAGAEAVPRPRRARG